MTRVDSDIIEIKIFDNTYQLFFAGKARIKDNKELRELNATLKDKSGLSLSKGKKDGWFD